MDELIRKYRANQLTAEEFKELRSKISTMSDEEVESYLLDDWLSFDTEADDNLKMRLTLIQHKLDSDIVRKKKKRRILSRIISSAAFVALAIFSAIVLYHNRSNESIIEQDIVMITHKGERASIILPDSSKVSLNFESTLRYTPRYFNKNSRKVNFEGEAYFEVTKDKDHPFVIETSNVLLKVLGTTFNLLVRDSGSSGEVVLLDGCVEIVTLKTDKTYRLNPQEKAIIDFATNTVTIIPHTEIEIPWLNGRLAFLNEPLKNILCILESNYNCRLTLQKEAILNESFSGSLPSNNLPLAIEILEKAFETHITINSDSSMSA